MRLTIIHPSIDHAPGQKYTGPWQMEPLPAATIAGLISPDVYIRFYDERLAVRYGPIFRKEVFKKQGMRFGLK